MKKKVFSFIFVAVLLVTLVNNLIFKKEVKEVELKNEMKFGLGDNYFSGGLNISFSEATMTPSFDPDIHSYVVELSPDTNVNGTICDYTTSGYSNNGGLRQFSGINGCRAAYILGNQNTKTIKLRPYYTVCEDAMFRNCHLEFASDNESYTFTLKKSDMTFTSPYNGDVFSFANGVTKNTGNNKYDVYLQFGVGTTTSSCEHSSMPVAGASINFKEFQGCGLTYNLQPGEDKDITIKKIYQCGYLGNCNPSDLSEDITITIHRPLDASALLEDMKLILAESKDRIVTATLSPAFNRYRFNYSTEVNFMPSIYAISGTSTTGKKVEQTISGVHRTNMSLTTRGEFDNYTYNVNIAASSLGPAVAYYGSLTTFRDISLKRLDDLFGMGTDASTYSSSDTSIVEIGDNRLIVKKDGTATITRIVGNSVASIDIVVKLLRPEKKADIRIVKKISIAALRNYLNSLSSEVKLYTDISEAPYLTNLSQTYTYDDLTIEIEDPSIASVEGDYLVVNREGITNVTISSGTTSVNYLLNATNSYDYQDSDNGIVLLTDDGYYEQSPNSNPIISTPTDNKKTESTSNPKTGIFDSLGLILIAVIMAVAVALIFINKKTEFKEM